MGVGYCYIIVFKKMFEICSCVNFLYNKGFITNTILVLFYFHLLFSNLPEKGSLLGAMTCLLVCFLTSLLV